MAAPTRPASCAWQSNELTASEAFRQLLVAGPPKLEVVERGDDDGMANPARFNQPRKVRHWHETGDEILAVVPF